MAVFTGRNATIRKILTIGYGVYRSTHNLPAHIERAVYDQLSCRTKHRGKHSEYCPDGHYVRSHYNSCHNRTCPQCSSLQLERWLKKQEAHLIACDHYHAIFTIAHEFNGIWMNNKKVMTSILFITARDTVFKLLVTGKYLKALPGIIGSLHTWTKTQLLHPHVHFLITGGGITPEGDRHPSKNGFLLSVKLAMKIFRTTFRWRVRKSYRKGELKLPPEITRKEFAKMLVETGRKKWNVYIEEKYSHGKGVLKYIVRYLKGGSISNQRVLKITDTKVTISYKDSKDRESNGKSKKKKM
ncbi:MAG: transposase, partial [Calditrichia bacterium]